MCHCLKSMIMLYIYMIYSLTFSHQGFSSTSSNLNLTKMQSIKGYLHSGQNMFGNDLFGPRYKMYGFEIANSSCHSNLVLFL